MADGAKYSGAWNFGPEADNAITVREMAEKIIACWGSGRYCCYDGKNARNIPHEANLLKLDISKSKELLNWAPRLTADEAIKKTIEWYKTYREANVGELCIRQINEIVNH